MEGHRRFFICGNWKRKITSARIGDLVPKLNAGAEGMTGDVEVVIAPPFVYLDRVRESLSSKFGVAAPNCWTYGAGKPCTGEVHQQQRRLKQPSCITIC